MQLSLQEIERIDRIPDHNAKMLAAAVMYAENEFYVIPVRWNQKAIPGTAYKIHYNNATNNPKTVAKWYGPGGKFEGWNVGLATGKEGGIFVVDLDIKSDCNGVESFQNMVPDGWQHSGPVQMTASGGRHLIYKWQEHMTSTANSLAKGIDTRGGLKDSFTSHVVAWPSKVNGNQYTWERDGEVEEVPAWLVLRMGGRNFKLHKGGRGNENVEDHDRELPLKIESIQEMLDVMDPEDYGHDDWTHIGMAIHSQYPGEDGMSLWDEWSSNDSRSQKDGKPMYDPKMVHAKWKGFDGSKGVRIGTLIYHARQAGFDQARLKNTNDDKILDLVLKMNERYAVVPMGGQMLISERIDVVEEVAAVQPAWRFWRREHFKNFLENRTIMAVNGKTNKTQMLSWAEVWLAHEDRNEYQNGVGLFPGKPARYKDHLNLWQGFIKEPAQGNWDLFKDHILNVVCDGNEDHYEWLLDWMADLFQDPGNPKGCAVVMHGVEGCGKGTFAQILGTAFGCHFKHVTDEEHLVGRFNGHLADAVLVFADEAVFGGNRKVAGKLKSLVTERIITSERKGVDAVQFQNCAHVMIASNEDWFIPAGPQSRRWFVLEFSPNRANDRLYFDAIHNQMYNEGGIEAMMHDLLERKITHDLKRAPETKALQQQRSFYVEMDSIKAWYFKLLATANLNCPPIRAEDYKEGEKQWLTEVSKDDILQSYEDWCKEHPRYYPKGANAVFKFLKDVGMRPKRFKVLGKRIYGYEVPEYEQAVQAAKYHGFNPDEEDYEDEDDTD